MQFVEAKLSEDEDYAFIKKMFQNQYLMERLRDDWEPYTSGGGELALQEMPSVVEVKNNVQSTKNSIQRTNENSTHG